MYSVSKIGEKFPQQLTPNTSKLKAALKPKTKESDVTHQTLQPESFESKSALYQDLLQKTDRINSGLILPSEEIQNIIDSQNPMLKVNLINSEQPIDTQQKYKLLEDSPFVSEALIKAQHRDLDNEMKDEVLKLKNPYTTIALVNNRNLTNNQKNDIIENKEPVYLAALINSGQSLDNQQQNKLSENKDFLVQDALNNAPHINAKK